jgi:4-hydroxythreonine-4-phosphate dehydrogenase
MEKNKKGKFGSKPIIGITLGDINGIGPEVIIKALSDTRLLNIITPVIYGSTKVLSYYRKSLDMEDFNYSQVRDNFFNAKKVNVVNCWNEVVEIKAGTSSKESGSYALKALERSAKDLNEGKINALVTGPINKNNIQSESFNFPGQTEFITKSSGASNSLMMMVGENLKVGLVTTHLPLRDVADQITKKNVAAKLKIFIDSLREDFGINKPKIAVLALNPHAGDDGLLGNEEMEIILPVIEDFKSKGYLAFGPYPPDGFFGIAQYKNFDGVLAMYHDQGLIAFKTLSFEIGVNYTAGLDVIRTSPDHGTAYNLAGKNTASEISMRAAIFLAKDIFKVRHPDYLDD